MKQDKLLQVVKEPTSQCKEYNVCSLMLVIKFLQLQKWLHHHQVIVLLVIIEINSGTNYNFE